MRYTLSGLALCLLLSLPGPAQSQSSGAEKIYDVLKLDEVANQYYDSLTLLSWLPKNVDRKTMVQGFRQRYLEKIVVSFTPTELAEIYRHIQLYQDPPPAYSKWYISHYEGFIYGHAEGGALIMYDPSASPRR